MKIPEISQSTKLVLMALVTAGALVVFYLGFGFVATTIGGWQINRQVNSGVNASQTYTREAANASANAANAAITRAVEDGVREKVIIPKLETARRNSSNSKTALNAAKRKYENEKLHPENLNSKLSDNCAALRRLFPNTAFDDCR